MSSIWDLTVIMLGQFSNWVWSGLATVGTSWTDLSLTTMNAIGDTLVGLAIAVLYLPMVLFGVMIDLLNIIIGSLTGLMNTVITGGNTLTSSFLGVFDGIMPGPWVAILGSIIVVNIVLRVYFYVKDISILGFKI